MKFSKLFKRHHKAAKEEDLFGPGTVVNENPLYESADNEFENPLYEKPVKDDFSDAETAEVSEQEVKEAATATQNIPSNDALSELKTQLLSAKKKHSRINRSKDSDSYKKIINYIDIIQNLMNSNPLGRGLAKDLEALQNIENAYQGLDKACRHYIKGNAHSSTGKARKQIVKSVQAYAEMDLSCMGGARSRLAQEVSDKKGLPGGWGELLAQGRIKHVDMDFNDLKKMGGGAISDVNMIREGSASVNGEKLHDDKIFKNEQIVDHSKTAYERGLDTFLKQYKQRQNAPDSSEKKDPLKGLNITDDMIAQLKNIYIDTSAIITLSKIYALKKPGKFPKPWEVKSLERLNIDLTKNRDTYTDMEKVYLEVAKYVRSESTLDNEILSTIGHENTDKLEMMKRNVATSRIAEALGAGHLIAHSDMAELHDINTGETKKGIMMDKAVGSSITSDKIDRIFTKRQREADAEKNRVSAENKKAQAEGRKPDAVEKHIDQIFEPSFTKDIMSLQVLDALCGQADRHQGNYMIQANDKGKLTGVQGIDNDSSFGLNTQVASASFFDRQDRLVYNDNDELVIPVDRQLAESIKAMSTSTIRMLVKDILSEPELDALATRLERLKKAISGADSSMIFDNEEDWSEEMAMTQLYGRIDPEESSAALAESRNLLDKKISKKQAERRKISPEKRYKFNRGLELQKQKVIGKVRSKGTYMDPFMK